ncbi:MAG: PIN domain-containing protein [Caulobacterales bacterium]
MARAVLDASAVIALLRDEAGADVIAGFIGDALISTVTLQEVVKALLVRGFTLELARTMIEALHLEPRAHTVEDAFAAAALYAATKARGCGLGDRTCMALAIAEGLPAITTDKEWSALAIPGLTVIQAR